MLEGVQQKRKQLALLYYSSYTVIELLIFSSRLIRMSIRIRSDSIAASLVLYLMKHLPTCIASSIENERRENRRVPQGEVAVALELYQDVFLKRNSLREFRIFSNKQIAQVYYSLLGKGERYVKSPRAWQKALMLEAAREERFIMDAMTYTTRERFKLLMDIVRIPSIQWYILLDLILVMKNYVRILPDGDMEVQNTREFFERLLS